MPINEQQIKKLNDWLKSKNVNLVCPSCKHNDWSAGDIVSAPTYHRGIVIGGPTIPMLQLICKNCAYIRLYAAVPIGLMDTEKEQEEHVEKTSEKD